MSYILLEKERKHFYKMCVLYSLYSVLFKSTFRLYGISDIFFLRNVSDLQDLLKQL